METIQYIVLIWRPQWNLRGSQRMQQRWRAATMVWQDVTSLRDQKDRSGLGPPTPTITNTQALDQTLLSPDIPGKEKEKKSGKRPVLTEPLTK